VNVMLSIEFPSEKKIYKYLKEKMILN